MMMIDAWRCDVNNVHDYNELWMMNFGMNIFVFMVSMKLGFIGQCKLCVYVGVNLKNKLV